MATDVLHTMTELNGPLYISLANHSLEYKFWAALRDYYNGPLTIEAQGSDEGARSFVLEQLGDQIEFPISGIRLVTLTAQYYPCAIGYGIVREAARVSENDLAPQTTMVTGTVSIAPVPQSSVTLTDRSGTLATAGVSQLLAPANTNRRYLLIQNVSTTEAMWINFTNAATSGQPSIMLATGAIFIMEAPVVSTEAVYVIAATAGHPWTAKEA